MYESCFWRTGYQVLGNLKYPGLPPCHADRRKSKQKEKKEKEKVMKSRDSVLGLHMNTPETSSPCADLFMRDHLLCPIRCCSTSSSLSMWSWTWWPLAWGLRSCNAWKATGQPPLPGRTLSTSWSPARCPASCDWTKARSCRPLRARPSDSTA